MEMPDKISVMFEVSEQCNQQCTFCYNTWKSPGEPKKKPLDTRQILNILEKVIDETACQCISLSGGEPMLREDLYDLISFIKKKNVKVVLISNGLLLTEDAINRCLSCGVDAFQISLLGDKPELHNRLIGVEGFEKVLDTILNIKNLNGTVYTFFVGLAQNIDKFEGVMELNTLLGIQNVAFGRFTPGGSGLSDWNKSMPSPEKIDDALEIGETFSKNYRVSMSISTPILPCLNDISKYKSIRFSFCGAGRKDHALFGIDPEGNLKVCSHSPYSLGNLLENSFHNLIQNPFLDDFQKALPEFCQDCPDKRFCRGGCPSSAHVCFGSLGSEDPYLKLWKFKARKPVSSSYNKTSCAEGTPLEE